MGKIKGDIYKYYMLKYDANDPANSSPRLPKWECRFCSKQYVQNATKMRHHVLNMCEEIPAPLKLALLDIPNVSVHDDSSEDGKMCLNSLGVSQSPSDLTTNKSGKRSVSKPPLKKRKTHSLPSQSLHGSLPAKLVQNIGGGLNSINAANNALSALSTLSNEQESLWVLIARAIYASGSSWSLLENPYWLDVFQRISPGITLPSKQMIGKELLDKEVAKIEAEVQKSVSDAKYVGVQCEAWMNNKSESMVTFAVTTPVPFSYKTFPAGIKQHSESFITDCAVNVIKDIELSQTKVLSFVTTTAEHMKSTWPKVQEIFPNVLTFGCIVDSLGSLLDDMLEHPHIGVVLDVIKLVVSKIKHSALLKAKFENIQSQLSNKIHKLYLTKRSKSISYLLSLQCVLNTQNAFKYLAVDEESLQIIGEELNLLVSEDFGTKIEILGKLFFPVIKWYSIMKDGKPEIASVPTAYVEIKSAFDALQGSVWQEDVYPSLLEMWSRRKELSMHSIHLAANLLDPRQQGSALDQDQVLQATEFIDNFCDQHGFDSIAVITELSQFRMKTDFYTKPFLWKVTEKVQGSVWWSTMAPKTHLAQLASAILNVCPSACSIPKLVDVGVDWTNTSRDCKLVYVSHNLRISRKATTVPDTKRARTSDNNSQGGLSQHNEGRTSAGIMDWTSLDTICNTSDSESEDDDSIKIEFVTLTPELYA